MKMTPLAADREIVSVRLLSFPPAAVFAAWEDPALLARWWGPHGFTNDFEMFDFRPEGDWIHTMRGPEGREFPNHARFVSISPDEEIIIDHLSEPKFRIVAQFVAEGAGTRLYFRMQFESAEKCAVVKRYAVDCNEENFDRLESLLAAEAAKRSPHELALSRVLAAAPSQVFRVWTRRLAEWWGPHGMTTSVCEMDLRPGGAFRTVMRAPDGAEYPTNGVFLEIIPDRRIVFTDAFHAGWVPNPEPFFTAIVDFQPLAGGKTRLVARAVHWSEDKCREHEAMGFHHGWSESLDRLARLVGEEPHILLPD